MMTERDCDNKFFGGRFDVLVGMNFDFFFFLFIYLLEMVLSCGGELEKRWV